MNAGLSGRRATVRPQGRAGGGLRVGLLAATSGSALAKKHKPKPKKPTVTTHTPVTKGSTYLALGDSVTFGYEEQQVVPAPNYADASSFFGYPELVGSELHLNVGQRGVPGRDVGEPDRRHVLRATAARTRQCRATRLQDDVPAARQLHGIAARLRGQLPEEAQERPAGVVDDRRERLLRLPGDHAGPLHELGRTRAQ